MAKQQTTGGGWLDRTKANTKAQGAIDNAVPVIDNGNAKAAPPQPEVKTPASAPVATVPAPEVVPPVVPEVPVAVETPTSIPEGKQVVRVTDDNTLIEIPGRKPKTAAQLNWELDQSSKLHEREEKLRLREERLEEERTRVVAPVIEKPKVQVVDKPVLPANLTVGDPEYDAAVAKLVAYESAEAIRVANQPLVERMERMEQETNSQREAQKSASENLAMNKKSYEGALRELPFDYERLPDETQVQVFQKIREKGLIDGIDIADPDHMQGKRLHPDTFAKFISRAFPFGSRPPGYEEARPSAELLALSQQRGPLVEQPKPDPLPPTGVGAVSPRPDVQPEKKKGPIPFRERLSTWSKPQQA